MRKIVVSIHVKYPKNAPQLYACYHNWCTAIFEGLLNQRQIKPYVVEKGMHFKVAKVPKILCD